MLAYDRSAPPSVDRSRDNGTVLHSNHGERQRMVEGSRSVPNNDVRVHHPDDGSEIVSDPPFLLHRKLLRRRHVLKERREAMAAKVQAATQTTTAIVGRKRTRDDLDNNMQRSDNDVAPTTAESPTNESNAISSAPSNIKSDMKQTIDDPSSVMTFRGLDDTGVTALYSPLPTRRRSTPQMSYDREVLHNSSL